MEDWIRIGRGIQGRKHPSRKHGVGYDVYCRGRYRIGGKLRIVGFGWQSEGWTKSKCMAELVRLKDNAKRGEGPTTFKEQREIADRRRAQEQEEQTRMEREGITFSQFFESTYIEVSRSSKKPGSFIKELEHFKLWLSPILGRVPLLKVSQIHLERVKSSMQKAGRSPRTIQYTFATFRQVWNLARSAGLVAGDSPSKAVKIPMIENKRVRYLTDEEQESLLSALRERSEQLYLMALTSLDTGARFSEVAGVRWSDVGEKVLTFRDTKMAGSTKSRSVPLTARLRNMFSSMPRAGELVFEARGGGVPQRVSKVFFDVVDSLGFNAGISDPRQKVCFHTIRHTYASRMIEAGADLYTVKTLLGHTTMATTERYSHLSDESLQEAVRRLEKKKRARVIRM